MISNTEKFEKALKDRISKKRFDHTMRVVDTALSLGEIYKVPKDKTKVAALLHDYAKNLASTELIEILENEGIAMTALEKNEPEILHGPAAAILVEKEFAITDKEILESIKYHTTGGKDLSDLAKIIYIADAIEPEREYPGVEKIREIAKINLDQAMLISLDISLKFLLENNKLIHPLSMETRNDLLMKRRSDIFE